MKSVPGLVLALLLAACTKQEPSPARSSATEEKSAPPAATISVVNQTPRTGDSPAVAAPKDPPVISSAKLTTPPDTSAAPVSSTPDSLPSGGSASTSAIEGAALFTATCATCHMADGYGVPYLQPSITGSAWISNPDPQPLLSLILRGSAILGEASQAYENDMAPQNHLTDAEIAAVTSYVRQRFAATPITDPVTPAQVALARSRPGLP